MIDLTTPLKPTASIRNANKIDCVIMFNTPQHGDVWFTWIVAPEYEQTVMTELTAVHAKTQTIHEALYRLWLLGHTPYELYSSTFATAIIESCGITPHQGFV